MPEEFRTPVNNTTAWIFSILIVGLMVASIFIEEFSAFAIGAFSVPIMMYFTHKYTRYRLEENELVIRQFLQKTKQIPYRDIYKIRKIDNARTMKWIHGKAFPTVEVYYNKFDMIAVLTGNYDEFYLALKTRMEQDTKATETVEAIAT